MGRTSRISREAYVRSCEGLAVQFRGPTRRRSREVFPYPDRVPYNALSCNVPCPSRASGLPPGGWRHAPVGRRM